ncbi:hypothetical protein ABK040_013825 [Willaertia magna]
MPKYSNLRCDTKLGSMEGMMKRFKTDDLMYSKGVFENGYYNDEGSGATNHKYILLGIISQDNKSHHYQFHSVNNLNNNSQINNQSTITHYLYLHTYWICSCYTPYGSIEFKLFDLKTKSIHTLIDAERNEPFRKSDYSDFFASVYQSVSLTNDDNDISSISNINLETLQPLDEYQLLDIIFYVKVYKYHKFRIILNFKNVLLSKVVKLKDDDNSYGGSYWGDRETIISLSNTYYLKGLKSGDENNELGIWAPKLSYVSETVEFSCLNDSQQSLLQFSNINVLNIKSEIKSDKYISFIKSGKNFCKESNEQYILHFSKKEGIYKLFKFDTRKLRILKKELRNASLLTNLEIIDSCSLNENLHLLAMKREDLSNINRVITIEELLLYEHILFFLLDLNSLTIKEISPIIYPLAMSKQLLNNLSNRNELEVDGFQIVVSKRKYRPNTHNSGKIYINNKIDINGGITNDALCSNYLSHNEHNYDFNHSSLPFPSGVKIDNFSMTSFREFNETNKDMFNISLVFNQLLGYKQKCEPFFVTLYFKVKDCCSGVVWYNNQALSDVSIHFK